MTTNRRVLPLPAVEAIVGRAFAVRTDTQQRAEGIERGEAPVKAKGELVEVGLKVLRADAVVRAAKPSLQVAENQVKVKFSHCSKRAQPLLGSVLI